MNKDDIKDKDTLEKLKMLMSNFNSLNMNIDIYSLYLNKKLKDRAKT